MAQAAKVVFGALGPSTAYVWDAVDFANGFFATPAAYFADLPHGQGQPSGRQISDGLNVVAGPLQIAWEDVDISAGMYAYEVCIIDLTDPNNPIVTSADVQATPGQNDPGGQLVTVWIASWGNYPLLGNRICRFEKFTPPPPPGCVTTDYGLEFVASR